MSEKIRIGILGLGIMGHRMLTNMPKEPRIEVVGAWDISQAECARAVTTFPGLNIADNAEALITSSDVDMIYIGVPPQFHYDYAVACVDAGKAIFCEKPLCVSVADGEKLVQLVARHKAFNAVNLSLVSAGAITTLKQELASGAFGRPLTVDINLNFSIWPRGWQQNAGWLCYREDGGFTREVTTHFLHLCDSLFGPGRVVKTTAHYPEDPQLCEARLDADLIFGETTVKLQSKIDANAEDKIEFHVKGEHKSFSLFDFYKGYIYANDQETALFADDEDTAELARNAQLSRLCDQYQTGVTELPTFEEAYRIQCLIENLLNG